MLRKATHETGTHLTKGEMCEPLKTANAFLPVGDLLPRQHKGHNDKHLCKHVGQEPQHKSALITVST